MVDRYPSGRAGSALIRWARSCSHVSRALDDAAWSGMLNSASEWIKAPIGNDAWFLPSCEALLGRAGSRQYLNARTGPLFLIGQNHAP